MSKKYLSFYKLNLLLVHKHIWIIYLKGNWTFEFEFEFSSLRTIWIKFEFYNIVVFSVG